MAAKRATYRYRSKAGVKPRPAPSAADPFATALLEVADDPATDTRVSTWLRRLALSDESGSGTIETGSERDKNAKR